LKVKPVQLKSRFFAALFAVVVLMCAPLFAEGTHTWKQSSFDDFEHGTAKGVAISSDGDLMLAPAFKAIYTSPSTYIWSIAADGTGNVYAAAGAPARVYRVTPDGQASVIFEPKELQVQALVVDTSGVLYAATSPDGKVYRVEQRKTKGKDKKAAAEEAKADSSVDSSFTASIFFDPKTKYIWDLALDPQGRLYVATGDHGEVYRVERNGEGSVFFKSDEAHIRVLAFDTRGNLIAGSDGSGLVYRVSPQGEAFVLYSAPKKEITALAIDQAGNIYAAGVGEKKAGGAAPSLAIPAPPQTKPAPQPAGTEVSPANPAPAAPFPVSASGSDIYKIAPDGSPTRVWSSRDDIVYALGFNERGHLLAGTGNKGRVFEIDGRGDYADLLKASANQVTAMTRAPNGGLYVSTSNLGKIFVIGAEADGDGTYESDVYDAKIFSRWGRAEVQGSGNYELYERTGNVDNPDRNWSPWRKVNFDKDSEAEVPAARFIQWKAVLRPGSTPARIASVTLNYRPNNVAPVIDDVTVQVGMRYQGPPRPTAGEGAPANNPGQPRFDAPPSPIRDHGSIGVRWSAHDDNDDELVYSVYYKGEQETQWKLLKDRISDKFYSWDAALFPDGAYAIKVVASDAPSHSPEEALTDERESARFEVDNTPPRVEDLHAVMEAGELHITFRADDNYSPIKRAEYSVDAGEWQFVEPVGLISDNRIENYDFNVRVPVAQADDTAGRTATKRVKKSEAPVEHVIVVRVYDRFDNMGSAKVVMRTAK
jgi:sugar lactone lactonase YvrE